jgi:cytidine deaminase
MITPLSNDAVIERAATLVKPKQIGPYLVGDVGCALQTDAGNVYLGVCMDVSSGIGFCAEHSAIAAMVTAGEFRIARIVAVWKNAQDGDALHVVSPCGRCREFMSQIDPGNLEALVILARDKVERLADLLPYHTWYHKV